MTSTEEHISMNIKTFESLTKKQQQLQKKAPIIKILSLFKIKN